MCGIAGKVDLDGSVPDGLIEGMCAVIEHRGPDSRGTHLEHGVALGAQRLAIIDRAGGDQPISNEDGSVIVVMNGEIYNHRELRAHLAGRGHRFATECDTEVLVHLYEEQGERLVDRLRGMFAFAIWDRPRRRLVLARDRVGKKPLFVARRANSLSFASEVRSLLVDPDFERRPNLVAIDAYLGLQYVPHPLSAFDGIDKLPPGSTLVFDESGVEIERYWRLSYEPKRMVADQDAEAELWGLIVDATRIRLMSEVPLGAFLSGGIDSSAIVAAMAEAASGTVKTFSIGFADDEFDELPYARMVAERFGTDHHEFQVEPHALGAMPQLARHYGEPFADPSAIPSFALAELTSKHVTVALNGDGGDESFAGYRRYLANDLAGRLDWLPRPLQRAAPAVSRMVGEGSRTNSLRSRVGRMSRALAMEPRDRYAMWMSPFDHARRDRLETPEFRAALGGRVAEHAIHDAWATAPAANRVDHMLSVDVETYLPANLLVKMDIATMAYSVEARSPFLDHRLMEFAAKLPAELKLSGNTGKRILASTLRGRIPDAILDRPKMGFGVPLRAWFRGELRGLPGEVLLDPASLDRGYFERPEIERLITEHHAEAADHSLRLWALLQLEMWHREVLEAPNGSQPEAAISS